MMASRRLTQLPRSAAKALGLTLVEVLIALAITAITLLAASQAIQASTRAVERQRQVTLAQLCADNILAALQLGGRYPSVGQMQSSCQQLGQEFTVVLHTSATPNPSFRRVQAQVLQDGQSILSVATVVGRY